MLMCGCRGMRACVREQSARYQRALGLTARTMRHAEEPVSSYFTMTVLTLSISLFLSLLTQARANAYVWVRGSARVHARKIRALLARAKAIRARYAPCRRASLFLLHHDCIDPVHFFFPKFTHTGAR
jgi:hypothetical protein